ncbi:uncharacterized protein J4E84_000997 [Alternaria hordeiaustralica]|uniref:uncharacterized protein n=1 Tax=Alternaria hordeiaustralica TaxID=1187925 RepID=UPI0020C2490D|nr:uncharacterized protein J4E84_000997 [Alternaria hordeiaustralica]KAI4697864.1 hypothetical protein J4E84_000997 [Alternaria hordeiaustralica]
MASPDSCETAAFTVKLPNVSGETIAVKVGLQIVDVHKDLISSSSEYFRKAISHESILSHRFIDLSDEKPHDFDIYCQWLYTRVLDAKLDNHNGFSYLARMYVLGEKLIDRTFQNDVVDAIIYRHITARLSQKPLRYKVPDLEAIGIIYKGAPRKAPVIRLLVDLWAFNMDSSWVTKTRLRAPENKPFLDDLLPALLDRRGLPDASQARPWISQRSFYYNKGVVIKSEMPEDRGGEAISEPSIKDEPSTEEESFVKNEPYVEDGTHIKEEPSMLDEPFIKQEPSSEKELSSEEESPSEDERSNKTDPSVQEEVDVIDAFWGM